MGRRSRARSKPAAPAPPAKGRSGAKAKTAGKTQTAAKTKPVPERRERAFDRLSPVRRILARYLIFAVIVAIATVLGIAGLGGTAGPLIVFAYVTIGASSTFRWAQQNLAGRAMTDEDRVMQTMAGGMLLLSTLLAVANAVLLAIV
ncbi:hypothetical protein DSM112329_03583 [Paraconexibacter sp. AEG42_29]|uniref:Uncharacterized protein n=1 Tax=Paraconexibacter sp. AEG42_29 TaxID=2997339 RepID=A0AAU7AZ00_9ACTN